MKPEQPDGAGPNRVEIRFFGRLKELADQKGLAFPCYLELDRECPAAELAERCGIPADNIEAVFVNGVARPLAEGRVEPGDRVGFVPFGTPGPYRLLLGFKKVTDHFGKTR